MKKNPGLRVYPLTKFVIFQFDSIRLVFSCNKEKRASNSTITKWLLEDRTFSWSCGSPKWLE